MVPVSVVIITKNEADIIACSIGKAKLLTNDIVVIDNGSTDGTVQIARELGCRVYHKNWEGYAANKNKGIELAEYDWILSMDADEILDDQLITSLRQLHLTNLMMVYDIKFRSYFGEKLIRFGKWGRDHHVRLFNRNVVKWSNSPVHETLTIPYGVAKKRLKGNILHYSVTDRNDFYTKSERYASLCAESYYQTGKHASFTKLYLSPLFNFLKNYIFFLGFLDGKDGWEIASLTVKHTWLKYNLLQKIEQQNRDTKAYHNQALIIEYR